MREYQRILGTSLKTEYPRTTFGFEFIDPVTQRTKFLYVMREPMVLDTVDQGHHLSLVLLIHPIQELFNQRFTIVFNSEYGKPVPLV